MKNSDNSGSGYFCATSKTYVRKEEKNVGWIRTNYTRIISPRVDYICSLNWYM